MCSTFDSNFKCTLTQYKHSTFILHYAFYQSSVCFITSITTAKQKAFIAI
jgi:hypothetical protein